MCDATGTFVLAGVVNDSPEMTGNDNSSRVEQQYWQFVLAGVGVEMNAGVAIEFLL
jgi:hypothetical protein